MENTEYGKYFPRAVIGSGHTTLGFAPEADDMTTALLIVKVRTVLWHAYWKGQRDYQKICTQCNAGLIKPFICRTVLTSDDLLLRLENIFSIDGAPYVRLPSLNEAEETWYMFGGSVDAFEKALHTASTRKVSLRKESFTRYAMTAVDGRFCETRQMCAIAHSAQEEYRIHKTESEKKLGTVTKNGRKTDLPHTGQKLRSALLESVRKDNGENEPEETARTFHALPLDIGEGEDRLKLNGCELYQLSDGQRAVLIPKGDIDKSGIIHTIQVLPGKKYYAFHMNRRGVYLDENPFLILGAELIGEMQKPDLREHNKDLLGRQLKISSPNEQEAVYESDSGVFRLLRLKSSIQVETFNDEYEQSGKRIHRFPRSELIPTFEEFLEKSGYGNRKLKRISQSELENRYKKAHRRRPFRQRPKNQSPERNSFRKETKWRRK